ncbi:MAG: NAD(P)H-hydrate dehydratase [Pirellulales bacterium]
MSDRSIPRLPPRRPDSHKGDFGSALLIGGSRGMSGAIAMAGMAAVRAGAGLVRLAVPNCCLETVATFSPCTMLLPVTRQDSSGRMAGVTDVLLDWVKRSDCVAIGPGMGRSSMLDLMVVDLLRWMVDHAPETAVVIDADGLNALSTCSNWQSKLPSRCVLTPHPGEWARLTGIPASQHDAQTDAAQKYAQQNGINVVLKGNRTLVTGRWQDGEYRAYRNETGTPAMATGGSGDVLTGIITALICQGLSPLDAARLGVHAHGRAGQLAESELGTHVVLPTDLVQYISRALTM